MGELHAVIEQVFQEYDVEMKGELDSGRLQMIHSDMRIGGISLPQVQESIKYACVDDACDRSELFGLLQEMDRRYFLLQDFRWEFSMLDTSNTDTITEEQAKWFMQMVHGEFFNKFRWELFLRSRAIPGSGVSFAEIEVMLCNIPSREEYLADLDEERRDRQEQENHQREMQKTLEGEKEKRRREREDERRKEEEEERQKRESENKRRDEEDEERRLRLLEKEEAERRRRRLEEEEERGLREAEERERSGREKRKREEVERAEKELREMERLKHLEEHRRKEQEKLRWQDLEEAQDYEDKLRDATVKERQADDEAMQHHQRRQQAHDDSNKKDAEAAEKRARLKQKDYRNKRIRYRLKVAIKRRDQVHLPPAVDDFKSAKLPDDDMDLPKAERLIKEFQARDGLKKAMTSRQLAELERAIGFVKRHGFELQLERELIQANKILLQLRRLERIRAEILELKQSTVAEIRSYQKPPEAVYTVMTGTFLLLGNQENETKAWKTVQALVGKTGKDGLKRRCLGLDPSDIDPRSGQRAKSLLEQFELDDIRDVSAGAATFYVWSWTMIEEMEARQEAQRLEKEEKQREKDEKKMQAAKEKTIQEDWLQKQKAIDEDGRRGGEGGGGGGGDGEGGEAAEAETVDEDKGGGEENAEQNEDCDGDNTSQEPCGATEGLQ